MYGLWLLCSYPGSLMLMPPPGPPNSSVFSWCGVSICSFEYCSASMLLAGGAREARASEAGR
eukprot:COSAG02_NODE_51_length_44689_cov_29.477361_13_plen_62_part_00